MSDFDIETQLLKGHSKFICGIDEVGRGALFGPVVAGAVILNPQELNHEIDDSKKLSAGKRLELARFIYSYARAYSLGWSWNDEIDRTNILQATKIAMNRAVCHLQVRPDFILLDGLDPGFLGIAGMKLIQGDRKSMSIAAASIIAKVFRDQLLRSFSRFFPAYDLENNKGYPTQKHKNMVLWKGMTLYHRESFTCKNAS
jgi:ribonuclease HII